MLPLLVLFGLAFDWVALTAIPEKQDELGWADSVSQSACGQVTGAREA